LLVLARRSLGNRVRAPAFDEEDVAASVLGQLFIKLQQSVRFFTVARAIRETAAGYFNLGMALGQLQRYAEAERAFRSALRRQPDYVQACLALADVLERQSQTAEAAALRERAARLQEAEKKRTDVRGL
jgi:uncharacterized protein HemY